MTRKNADFTYKIIKDYGTVEECSGGWTIRLMLIQWNDKAPKLDLRSWNEDLTKMGKGIGINTINANKLVELLNMASSQDFKG